MSILAQQIGGAKQAAPLPPYMRGGQTAKWSHRYAVLLGLLLIFTAFHQTKINLLRSVYWNPVEVWPVVVFLREIAIYAQGLVLGSILLVALVRRPTFNFSITQILFMFLFFIPSIRSAFSDGAQSLNFTISTAIAFAIMFFMQTIAKEEGYDLKSIVMISFIIFASFFVIVNFAGLILGYGYASGNQRLFGTAVHPNFLAVQAAIAVVILARPPASIVGRSRPLFSLLCVAGAVMMVLTGSRTGFLMSVVGVYALTYSSAKQKLRFHILSISVLFLSVIVFFAFSSLTGFSLEGIGFLYDRAGNEQERFALWRALWAIVEENPFFGLGMFSDATESSFLKGWAAFGVFYAALFLILLMLTVSALWKATRRVPHHPGAPLFLSLMMALIVGSVFEGFLVENFGFTAVVWASLISVGSEREWRR